MSVSCGVECVLLLGCSRWAWKRCTYIGSDDSDTWPLATADEFEPVPRISRLILAVYEVNLRNPQFGPSGGYRLNPDWVVKRVTYEQTLGHAPPYLIYTDHDHREIVLAIRGLNLVKESDYKLLLDNRLGMQMFDGGYVHHGLLKSAIWLLNEESETLKSLWVDNGSEYRMVFAGHSLGSGVASLLSIIVVNHGDRLGGIPRSKIRCYALAPARCMSLNLAVKYADVVHSVVLQDDFLPRTATPLEDIFKSLFCLPCLLFLVCLRDTFIPEGRKLRDPRRLYAPGRIYHIVERRFCRCGRYPPEVRTAIPVDGRFEHIVLSCNATSDHGIIWIEREAEKALERMRESSSETVMVPPSTQRFERLQTIEKEHKDALERAVSLNIPHAVNTPEDEAPENEVLRPSKSEGDDAPNTKSQSSGGRVNWDEVVEQLFKRNESGDLLLKRDPDVPT
ncbi:Sn1-specific diacylglycerol lipase alpha [Quillaja saponaria]|uniref:Sn1-specific diacylglycerol lipase alpha n=1 Tax=Quillaja saponaria TaxID=32244 RepID=A0AAD7LUE7_QUISA|nr:Sn1-specific diacylglycerol lipase alpha [Quillaja saponaria]KAJ7964478.1 Sn1-specific diacylglycerol lipase alpha [Quillaja saponaria]